MTEGKLIEQKLKGLNLSLWNIPLTLQKQKTPIRELLGQNEDKNTHYLGYSLVPIRRHGSINQHTSFIWPCTFPKIWGVTINWINTQFWSTSRGTFDKNNSAPIAYTFEGVSFNWIMTFSMPWGMTINWNMSSNWNQRVLVNDIQNKLD